MASRQIMPHGLSRLRQSHNAILSRCFSVTRPSQLGLQQKTFTRTAIPYENVSGTPRHIVMGLSHAPRHAAKQHTIASPAQAQTQTSSLDAQQQEQQPQSSPPTPYTPPKTGILAHIPPSWVPYGELIRLDKPAGTYYLFFPCLFSTLLAAPLTHAPPTTILTTSLLFLSGAFIMRGAGCAVNDLWDRNLDPHVTRTRHRPLARGALTPLSALIFTAANMAAGCAILLQFPILVFPYAVPSLALVAAYPLCKRVTYYPQFVLGLTFSWGAFLGFPALGLDFLSSSPSSFAAAAGAGALYASNVAWTVLYDMIYAHMDIRDDAKAGIKSIALKHDADTKKVLSGLAAVQVGLLGAAGFAVGAGPAFYLGSCGGAALTLGWMIRRVDLKNVRDCWWWFVNGCWITGGTVSLGLGADYLIRYYGDDDAVVGENEKTRYKEALEETGWKYAKKFIESVRS